MALVVFTGGARSGKSGAATRLVTSRVGDGGATIVVFGRETEDDEFAERIARHRAERPAHWTTVEAQDASGWTAGVPEGETVLIDCMGTLLGLIMDEAGSEAEYADSGRAARRIRGAMSRRCWTASSPGS